MGTGFGVAELDSWNWSRICVDSEFRRGALNDLLLQDSCGGLTLLIYAIPTHILFGNEEYVREVCTMLETGATRYDTAG